MCSGTKELIYVCVCVGGGSMDLYILVYGV